MVTKYPAAIDTVFTLKPLVDGQPVTGKSVDQLREAIIAIEEELGVKPSAVYTTVRNRLDVIENIVGNLRVIELEGDLGGTLETPLVIGIQGRPVSDVEPIEGEVLVWDGIAWVPAPGPSAVINFAGDLAGNPITQTVIGIQGRPILTTAPTSGQTLVWGGSSWAPGTITGGASGPAGGDLTGTYPNPIVKQSSHPSFTIFGSEFAFTGGLAPQGFDLPATDALRVGTITTTNKKTTINSVPVYNRQLIRVMSEIGATRTDIPGDAAWFLLRGVWLREQNSIITVKPSTVVDSASTPGASSWAAELTPSGTNITTQVTGESGKTIQWSVIREWMESMGGDHDNCPTPPYTDPTSVTFDGSFLWITDKNSTIITKVDPFTEAPMVVSTLDISIVNYDPDFGSSLLSPNTGVRHIKYMDGYLFASCNDSSGLLVIIDLLTEQPVGFATVNNDLGLSGFELFKCIWSQTTGDGNVWAVKVGDSINGSFAGTLVKFSIAEILDAYPNIVAPTPSNVFPAPAHSPIAQCHLETLTFGAGFLWASGGALNGNPNSPIFRIDPADGTYTTHVFTGNTSNIWGVHFAFGSLWASTYGRYVLRFNPATFPSEPDFIIDTFPNTSNGSSEMGDDGVRLYVANISFNNPSNFNIVDPNTNTATTRVTTTVNGGTASPIFDGLNLWMTARNSSSPSLIKIDKTIGDEQIVTYLPPPFDTPHTLTFDGTHLWVGDTGSSFLFKITTDPNTQPCPGCSKMIDLSSFGVNGVREIRYNDGIVYACCFNDNKVVLVNTTTDTVVGVCDVDNRSRSVTFDGAGNFWTSTINSSTLLYCTVYKFSIADTLAAFPSSPTPLFQHTLSHHVETLAFTNGFLWLSSGGFQNFGATDYFGGGSAASLVGSTLSGLTGMTSEMTGYYIILNNCSVSSNNAMFSMSFVDANTVTLFPYAVSPTTDGNNGAIQWNLVRAQAEPLMRIDPNDLRTGSAASITVSGSFNRTVTISGLTGMTNDDVGKAISIQGAVGSCFGGFNNNNVLNILTVVDPNTVTVELGYIASQGPPGYNSSCPQPTTDPNNGSLSWMLLVSHNAWDFNENAYVWGIFPAYGSIWAGDGNNGVQRWDINNYQPMPSFFPLATANPKSIVSPTGKDFFQGEFADDGQTVWTTAGYGGSQSAIRIDPVTNTIIAEPATDDTDGPWLDGCAYDGHNIWVTVRNNSRPGIVRFSTTLGGEAQNFRISKA